MKIIKPYIEIMEEIDHDKILKKLECCGRTCYKSEDKITEESAARFIKGIVKSGHESVIEHQNITVKFVCDRGVSHEIVRHRLASYSQESTRYCNYEYDFAVIRPCYLEKRKKEWGQWFYAMNCAQEYYTNMLKLGCKPEEARAVLPNSLKTEVVMTANLREWRHFFKQRCQKAAHPQIRELALALLKYFHEELPEVFEDLWEIYYYSDIAFDLPEVREAWQTE